MPKTINQALPRELLAYIFEVGLIQEQCGEDVEENPDSEIDNAKIDTHLEFPVLVSCVCKYWQDVALSTPTLWASVNVWDSTAFEWLQKRIGLSKEAPLDIQVDLSEDIKEMPEDMMGLLVDEARRWRRLDCTLQSDHAVDAILSQFKGLRAPLLETFTMVDDSTSVFSSFYRPPTVYELFDGPGSLPKLRTASLWSVPLEWDNNPFQNLRELEICYIPDSSKPKLSQFRDLLQASPQLEVLLICNGAIQPADLEDISERSSACLKPVHLPSLVALTYVDFDSPDLLSQTIRLVDAPNLKHLGITDMYEDEDAETIDFSPSIEVLVSGDDGRLGSRFPLLESLKFARTHSPSPDNLDRFFSGLVRLKRLHLIFPRVPYDEEMDTSRYLLPFASQEVRQKLGRPSLPQQVVCPLLEELTIAGRELEGLILEFARTRKSLGHPLKRIFYDRRDPDEQNRGVVGGPPETEIIEYEESDASVSDSSQEDQDSDLDEEDWDEDVDDADEEDWDEDVDGSDEDEGD
ncbi:hypothetical protein FRC04_011961 [Tulasnella sp. 424]|nr:hypothetical protein FRC04_011961 [Tulasnella sp. 424]KAG8971339.1 hypothetical protein FRC05_011331 [Tulasnella sp. 425]